MSFGKDDSLDKDFDEAIGSLEDSLRDPNFDGLPPASVKGVSGGFEKSSEEELQSALPVASEDDSEPVSGIVEGELEEETDSDVTVASSDEIIDKFFSSGKYFEDDEDFLAGDDLTLHDGDVLSMFQQQEDVVAIEILNLYTDEGNLRNRLQLRNDPPILQIKSSDGQVAQFVLTKNFSKGLSGKFDDVYSAYFGLESKSSKARKREARRNGESKNLNDYANSAVEWVLDNKFKSVLLLVVFALVVFGLVI